MQKIDKLIYGAIFGILLPVALYFIFVWPDIKKFSIIGKPFGNIVLDCLPIFLSRCIFPNALLFFLLLWKDLVGLAKGILISTVALTAILLFISFVL